MSTLDRLHARVRGIGVLRHFTAFTRVLLAVGFLPPGLIKVLGLPFTALPPGHPVRHFFAAFQRAGPWYGFVGWAQVAAALLLLLPRTATLGAVLYFPIIVNIAVLTAAIDFAGTVAATWLMALACLYLLAWDWDRLRGILPAPLPSGGGTGRGAWLAYPAGFAALAAGGFTTLAALRVAGLHEGGAAGGAGAAVAGALFGAVVAGHVAAMPRASPRGDGAASR